MEDRGVPNDEWSKESVELFNRLSKMGDDWTKLRRDISVRTDGSKLFLGSNSEPGKLFEYAMFNNSKLKRLKAVVQFGPFTNGPSGLVHGGAMASVLDVAMGNCAYYSGYKAVTANLNIDYIRPLPLNTTTLVEANIDKIEGRKVFVSGAIKAADDCENYVYSKGTSVFVTPPVPS